MFGDDGLPHLYLFENCTHLIRTLPVLTHDKHRIEDVDTSQEDHAADALRYGVMSRPYLTQAPALEEDPWRDPTLGEWPAPKKQRETRI